MKKLVLVGLVLALSGGAVGASVAQDKAAASDEAAATDKRFEAASAAYESEDYEAAFGIWSSLAQSGYATAQFLVGVGYESGRGVTQDYAAAASWYRKASRLRHGLITTKH